MSIRLAVNAVVKKFGNRTVIKGVSFDSEAPGSVGITGPNGSGKTTLLKLLSGLYAPDRGEIVVEHRGKPIKQEEYPGVIKMVSPELSLYAMLSACENLSFFAAVSGVLCNRERQEALLAEVGLAGRGNDRVGTYSSGMKQRLKYALALMAEPDILLLDEPTANLDEQGKSVIKAIMERYRSKKMLIVATNEAEDLKDVDEVIQLGH